MGFSACQRGEYIYEGADTQVKEKQNEKMKATAIVKAAVTMRPAHNTNLLKPINIKLISSPAL